MNDGTVRVGIFCRSTSVEGATRQREACRAFVASQPDRGWDASVREYSDSRQSGCQTRRPALQRLKEAARRGTIGIVVVDDPTRLGRSAAALVRTLVCLSACGVSVVSVAEGLSTDPALHRRPFAKNVTPSTPIE